MRLPFVRIVVIKWPEATVIQYGPVIKPKKPHVISGNQPENWGRGKSACCSYKLCHRRGRESVRANSVGTCGFDLYRKQRSALLGNYVDASATPWRPSPGKPSSFQKLRYL